MLSFYKNKQHYWFSIYIIPLFLDKFLQFLKEENLILNFLNENLKKKDSFSLMEEFWLMLLLLNMDSSCVNFLWFQQSFLHKKRKFTKFSKLELGLQFNLRKIKFKKKVFFFEFYFPILEYINYFIYKPISFLSLTEIKIKNKSKVLKKNLNNTLTLSLFYRSRGDDAYFFIFANMYKKHVFTCNFFYNQILEKKAFFWKIKSFFFIIKLKKKLKIKWNFSSPKDNILFTTWKNEFYFFIKKVRILLYKKNKNDFFFF